MSADSKPPVLADCARRVRLGELISPAKVEKCGSRELPILSITKENGIVFQEEKFKKRIASVDVTGYKVVSRGKLVQGIHIDEANFGIQGLVDCGIVSPAYKVWDVNDSLVVPEYLAAALRSPRSISYYRAMLSGTVNRRGRMSNEVFYKLDIALPSLQEQLRVLELLDKAHGLLENARRLLTLLDDLVKSRFVEMFGDPFENPMGFSCQNLSSLGELKNGMNFHKGESGVDIRCLGVADFGDRSELRDASELGTASLSTFPPEGAFLRDGDVVFVRSNGNKKLVGRCMAVYPGEEKTIFSGFCIRLRVTSEDVRVPYLVWALKQSSIRDALVGRGANIKNLSQDTLGKVRLPIPPLNVQDTFLDFAACVAKSQLVVQKQIERLQTLYDSLAQNYFG